MNPFLAIGKVLEPYCHEGLVVFVRGRCRFSRSSQAVSRFLPITFRLGCHSSPPPTSSMSNRASRGLQNSPCRAPTKRSKPPQRMAAEAACRRRRWTEGCNSAARPTLCGQFCSGARPQLRVAHRRDAGGAERTLLTPYHYSCCWSPLATRDFSSCKGMDGWHRLKNFAITQRSACGCQKSTLTNGTAGSGWPQSGTPSLTSSPNKSRQSRRAKPSLCSRRVRSFLPFRDIHDCRQARRRRWRFVDRERSPSGRGPAQPSKREPSLPQVVMMSVTLAARCMRYRYGLSS